jgi:hypothetical protein
MATATEEEVEAVPGERSQRWVHEGQVDWIYTTYDIDLSNHKQYGPADIACILYATRVDWRQSPEYAQLKLDHAQEVEDAKAEAAAERERAKAAKPTKAPAKAAKATKKAPAKKVTKAPAKAAARKAVAKKTAATKAKPASRARGRAAAKPADDDSPFE